MTQSGETVTSPTYHVRLSDSPSDCMSVQVVEGELIVRDVNGAPILKLAGPATTGIPQLQLESYLGIARSPGYPR